ncbi:MAG TPA: hypothetical protein VLE27_09195 [Thermoanaerobaculia bacterium]|nr:hypothetical protein [Thermoanaerobaculia bacterium]
MDSRKLVSVVYYTCLALEHRFTAEDLRKYPILAGLSSEPTPEEQDAASQWLEEIQSQEGRPIDQLDYEVIKKYMGEILDISSRRRQEATRHYSPEETQQLLENLRRAVPSPAEENWMKWRKAG